MMAMPDGMGPIEYHAAYRRRCAGCVGRGCSRCAERMRPCAACRQTRIDFIRKKYVDAIFADGYVGGDGIDADLYRAAELGDLFNILRFVHNASLKFRLPEGRSALHAAARGGYTGIVLALLEHGVGPCAVDGSGHTPLYDAYLGGHTDVAMLLVRYQKMSHGVLDYGADPLRGKISGLPLADLERMIDDVISEIQSRHMYNRLAMCDIYARPAAVSEGQRRLSNLPMPSLMWLARNAFNDWEARLRQMQRSMVEGAPDAGDPATVPDRLRDLEAQQNREKEEALAASGATLAAPSAPSQSLSAPEVPGQRQLPPPSSSSSLSPPPLSQKQQQRQHTQASAAAATAAAPRSLLAKMVSNHSVEIDSLVHGAIKDSSSRTGDASDDMTPEERNRRLLASLEEALQGVSASVTQFMTICKQQKAAAEHTASVTEVCERIEAVDRILPQSGPEQETDEGRMRPIRDSLQVRRMRRTC